MKNQSYFVLFLSLSTVCNFAFAQNNSPERSGNPVFSGWYADPEAIIFDNTYWIYPTFSDDSGQIVQPTTFSEFQLELHNNTINPQYLKQVFLDAFSSKDLVHWKKHSRVLDIKNVS